jgi:hypothetical protein
MARGRTAEVSPKETEIAVEKGATTKDRRGQYQRTGIGEIVYMHKSRTTGSTIAVLRGPAELGYGSGDKWVSLCLDHHQFTVFDTRVAATSMSTNSDAWCSECKNSKAKRRGKKFAA